MPIDRNAAKKILANCVYNPAARHRYDILRGGFVWEDEAPEIDSDNFRKVIPILAPVIAYRASLTLGQPRSELQSYWEELQAILPSWPGFREERVFGSVERDLKAVKLKENRCYRKLEKELGD